MSRKVQVYAKRTSPVRGLTATGSIKVTGTIYGDSFDSAAGPYSTNTSKENCFIGTTSKILNDFDVTGTADVVGQLGVGAPGVLKGTGGGNSSVGSKLYVDAGYTGVEPGYVQDDLNVSIDSVVLPFDPATASGPTVGTNIISALPLPRIVTTYTFNSGNYAMTDLILGANTVAIVKSNAVLSVRNLQVDGGALIVESNASFEVYFSRTVRLNSDSVTNATWQPIKLSFYGLSGATTAFLTGTARIYAYIYAPTAKLTLAGTAEFFGGSITESIDITGNTKYHYDESLLRQNYRFVPVSWREL